MKNRIKVEMELTDLRDGTPLEIENALVAILNNQQNRPTRFQIHFVKASVIPLEAEAQVLENELAQWTCRRCLLMNRSASAVACRFCGADRPPHNS